MLMGILFFNWYGYQLVSSFLESRADRQLEARLDNNKYDDSQLILIKVASTHLSYYNSSTQFERVDGKIEVGGIEYKYVKRRLYNDSLELLCIPNQTAMGLKSAKNEFFQLVNDLQSHNGQDKKSDSHGASKNVSASDYDTNQAMTTPGAPGFTLLPKALQYEFLIIASSYVLTAEHPPDIAVSSC